MLFVEEYKTNVFTEYIFAPFNTFIYLNTDMIRLEGMGNVKRKLIDYLNKKEILFLSPAVLIEGPLWREKTSTRPHT